jgi:hypothetical protein
VNYTPDGALESWTVQWYGASKGSAKGCFYPIEGSTEELPAKPETLVCTFYKLISRGKKLPRKALKEAIIVLQTVQAAEENGCGAECVACGEHQEEEAVVHCECCSKTYHHCCAPGLNATNHCSWWCPSCSTAHGVTV